MEKSFDFGKLLQNHEKKHKSKPTQFVSVAGGIKKRVENCVRNRKSHRLTIFDKIRNIPRHESPVKKIDNKSKLEHRMKQLEKWKEEKQKKKSEEAARKKKPFVAGVAHNPLTFVPPPPLKPMPSTSGRVTRSQTLRNNKEKVARTESYKSKPLQSFAPKNAKFNPVLTNMVKLPFEPPKADSKKTKACNINMNVNSSKASNKEIKTGKLKPKVGIKSTKNNVISDSSSSDCSLQAPIKNRKSPRKSTKPKSITSKNNIPKSESSSEEKLKSPRLSNSLPMTPEQIVEVVQNMQSPCVTMSRGKESARKEMKKKIEDGLLDDDVCEMDSLEHFRKQLDSEIKRMTEMCNTWDKIYEQIALPDHIQELYLAATGQARLLMSKKLQQFASLLARAEHPEPGAGLVTLTDLHGFWDMVFMQIENIDMRFNKLEELRAHNWAEEISKAPPAAKGPRPAPRAPPQRAPANSRLKDLIAAKRKQRKEQEKEVEACDESKTFEAGFFSVRSPIRAANTPRRSMLQTVLSNEANRVSASKNKASMAMLRASLIGKNVDSDEGLLTANPVLLTPINLEATPARSILKSAKSQKKSIKVVLFDQSDSELNTSAAEKEEGVKEKVTGVDKLTDIHTDVHEDNAVQKENVTPHRRSKLVRQEAVEERSPVMTRSRRKSINTPLIEEKIERTPRKTRKAQALKEIEVNTINENLNSPKKSSRRKSSMASVI